MAVMRASVIAPAYDIAAWRKRIPLLASCIPMNNCSHAPQTDITRDAAERYLDVWNTRGMDWDAWMLEVRFAKEAFAKLINASADEIAVFSSVSEATSAVASAIDFRAKRHKVVVTEAEFPTVGHVWAAQQKLGAELVWLPVTSGAIEPSQYDIAIDDDTAIVSACHAYYLNGFTQDLATIAKQAHAHGALLYADAYQSLGTMPIDVKALDVDFLASGNLKFLMGVPGIAFLYVRKSLIGSLHPTVTGWFGRENPYAFETKNLDWAPTASRFDSGTPPIMNAYIARAGMEIISSIGIEKIHAWHHVLAYRLYDGGRARGFKMPYHPDYPDKTVTTAFLVRDSHDVEAKMRVRGVLPSARGPVIRLAPHFYSTIDDVDTALDLLKEVTA
jgi:selenocysteine lyase/cysteine desulfurase